MIRGTGCAYGKFLHGKACFVSRRLYSDLANYRRDGYDFDARYEDGLSGYQDKVIYDILSSNTSLISREWRRLAGIKDRSGSDAAVTLLQMQGYVVTADFGYSVSRDGTIYGWGLARYATPEHCFGEDFTDHVYDCTPEESRLRLEDHLRALLPQAAAGQTAKIIG